MAIFSDLPDDLIIDIWGYMYEPEDVESFALVSKGVYSLSTRFVREHNHLKRQFSKMRVERYHTEEASTPPELVEKIFLNPRSALYIRELQIWDYGNGLDAPFTGLTENTKATFIREVQNSSFIASAEIELWIGYVQHGNYGRILGLVLMRLPKLQKLGIRGSYMGYNHGLLETLARMEESAESHSHTPGPSIIPKIRVLEFVDCELGFAKISGLSLSKKKMIGFSYHGRHAIQPQTSNIVSELLESSQHSLRKLCLHADGAGRYPLGDVTRFCVLAELEADFIPLLGSRDGKCNVLTDVLPTSIEKVTLILDRTITLAAITKVILEVIKSKFERLPKLEALTFKFERFSYFSPSDQIRPIDWFQDASAKVGVHLSAMEHSRHQ